MTVQTPEKTVIDLNAVRGELADLNSLRNVLTSSPANPLPINVQVSKVRLKFTRKDRIFNLLQSMLLDVVDQTINDLEREINKV